MSKKSALILVIALITGFLLGTFWSSDFVVGQFADGPDVECISISESAICQDDEFTRLPMDFVDEVGGIRMVICGFVRPGQSAPQNTYISAEMLASSQCEDTRYVLVFDNGAKQTNLWISGGRVVRIDEYNSRGIDL